MAGSGKRLESVDLLRVGVFLVGVAAVVLAGIALDSYLNARKSDMFDTGPFRSYCSMGAVVVEAREDLANVTVSGANGTVYCVFPVVSRGSEIACEVDPGRVYMVEAGGVSRVATCYEVRLPAPAGAGD